MILELHGQGGVGKFTIGRTVAEAMGARLIDNHVIYNPAFATTQFRSAEFYETVRAVRSITFAQAEKLPSATPIILTIAPTRDFEWAKEWQSAIRGLADRRGAALLGVHLHCAREENRRRLSTPSRALLRKLTDPTVLDDGFERPIMLDHCDDVFQLDVTSLSPSAASDRILEWVASRGMKDR